MFGGDFDDILSDDETDATETRRRVMTVSNRTLMILAQVCRLQTTSCRLMRLHIHRIQTSSAIWMRLKMIFSTFRNLIRVSFDRDGQT